MSSRSQRISTNGGRNGHNRAKGGQKQYIAKGNKISRQNKRSGLTKTPDSHRQTSETNLACESDLDQAMQPHSLALSAEASTLKARLTSIKVLQPRWRAEDELADLHSEEIVACQRQRYRDVGLIIFGSALQEAQIDAVYTVFYEQRDLLLLAKTGFGKSLIFLLIPFMLDPTGVVIILMPLKLLQAEQNAMISRIPTGKAIALTGENSQKPTQVDIATRSYTHVFTSPEIALSKKFKLNVLDNSLFASKLSLLAIDEIQLVEEWGKNFRSLYAGIDKIRKRISGHVPLLGVSVTLSEGARLHILAKAGFRDDYRLMQTSLDWPEIHQIHRFMQHSKSSCLDVQFVLPPKAMHAKDIQKTIIFVNPVYGR